MDFIFWNSQVPLIKFTVTSSLYEDMLETSLNSLQIHTNNSAMEHAWINIPTEQFKHLRLHATLCHYHYSDKRKSYVLLSCCLIFWHFSFLNKVGSTFFVILIKCPIENSAGNEIC